MRAACRCSPTAIRHVDRWHLLLAIGGKYAQPSVVIAVTPCRPN
jgi:hypothetical protein